MRSRIAAGSILRIPLPPPTSLYGTAARGLSFFFVIPCDDTSHQGDMLQELNSYSSMRSIKDVNLSLAVVVELSIVGLFN
jgi:hypothetical protein